MLRAHNSLLAPDGGGEAFVVIDPECSAPSRPVMDHLVKPRIGVQRHITHTALT